MIRPTNVAPEIAKLKTLTPGEAATVTAGAGGGWGDGTVNPH